MTLRKTAHGEVLGTAGSADTRTASMQSAQPPWSLEDEDAFADENMLSGPTDDFATHTE